MAKPIFTELIPDFLTEVIEPVTDFEFNTAEVEIANPVHKVKIVHLGETWA